MALVLYFRDKYFLTLLKSHSDKIHCGFLFTNTQTFSNFCRLSGSDVCMFVPHVTIMSLSYL